jgi:tetratricopeptide (TPR) repeat protein
VDAARGRPAEAAERFRRATEIFDGYGAAYYALGLAYRDLARSDDAQAALRLYEAHRMEAPALEDPVLARVRQLKTGALARLAEGVRLGTEGDFEGALREHEAALEADPSLAQAHANLISLYGNARNWAKAEEHYRALVALGVNLGDAHYDYGVLLGLQEKWDLAADAYRAAIAVNPQHARARNNLGQILERQRQIDAAAAEYRHAVESQPSYRLARFNLGRMLIALGKTDEAISVLETLKEPRDAEAPRYLFALATAYVRAGRKDEGIKWANDAKALALEHGQHDLAAAIEGELARLR